MATRNCIKWAHDQLFRLQLEATTPSLVLSRRHASIDIFWLCALSRSVVFNNRGAKLYNTGPQPVVDQENFNIKCVTCGGIQFLNVLETLTSI